MKEKTKKYLRNLGIAYLFAILGLTFKFCRNDKINDFYTLTNETLSSGDVEIYDEELNVIGKLQYINENNKLFLITGVAAPLISLAISCTFTLTLFDLT